MKEAMVPIAVMALSLTVSFGLLAIGEIGPVEAKPGLAATNSITVRTNIMHGYVRTNLVNEIIASGEFCAVRGHAWLDYVPPTPMASTLELNLDADGNISPKTYWPPIMRKCSVCGLKQSKFVREEWK